jgi:hypothetical protein
MVVYGMTLCTKFTEAIPGRSLSNVRIWLTVSLAIDGMMCGSGVVEQRLSLGVVNMTRFVNNARSLSKSLENMALMSQLDITY